MSTTCIACSIFRPELTALAEAGEIDLSIRYVDSMLHTRPQELRRRLDTMVDEELAAGRQVLLLFGDCHSHMSEHEQMPGVWRVGGMNCTEIVLGAERYRSLRAQGGFFLMPEWAARWREALEAELGLSSAVGSQLMRELHSRLVYLDTGRAPVPTAQLRELADYSGLPCEVVRIDRGHLLAAIRSTQERMAHHAR